VGSVLVLGFMLMPVAHTQPSINVQTEVNALLDFVGAAGCEFYRNGIWTNSKTAQAHLRKKYIYLLENDLINSTEDFIEKAGTKSSLSGLPYEVSCNGGDRKSSKQWLLDELAHLRRF
jgi:hypothetical protein